MLVSNAYGYCMGLGWGAAVGRGVWGLGTRRDTWKGLIILAHKAVQDAAGEQGVEVVDEVRGHSREAEVLLPQHGSAASGQLQQAGQEGQRLVCSWGLLLLCHSLQPSDHLPQCYCLTIVIIERSRWVHRAQPFSKLEE